MTENHPECSELLELLVDFIDGEETIEVRQKIMVHLETCDKCSRLLWSMRRVVAYCQAESNCDMPVQVRQRLWEALGREFKAGDPDETGT